jgi:hypothetical protein
VYSQSEDEDKNAKQNTWYIISDLDGGINKSIYENRFKIEKLFQDWKSSGFDIEKTKLKSSQSVKRLIFFVGLAQALSVSIGYYLQNIKKTVSKYRARIYSLFRLGLDSLQASWKSLENFLETFFGDNKAFRRIDSG